jgi:spore maturation protein CgeB
MGANDIVALMANDLGPLGDIKVIDTELYTGKESPWVWREHKSSPEPVQLNWLKDDKVRSLVSESHPDVIICNAGGMSFTPEMKAELKAQGITTVGIALSDPDVFASQGRHIAGLFDLYYTNARVSLEQYAKIGVEARLLPFAASPSFHRPMPDVPKKYDVLVVGHARADRLPVVAALDKHFKVGLYGSGWKRWGLLPRGHQVNGLEQVKALNTGKAYISFSRTVAGYVNVKVGLFEAIACGLAVFTERFPEMEDYFTYGDEIVGYESTEDLVDKLKYYLGHPEALQQLAERGRARLLRDHTWEKRWQQVLGDVRTLRG